MLAFARVAQDIALAIAKARNDLRSPMTTVSNACCSALEGEKQKTGVFWGYVSPGVQPRSPIFPLFLCRISPSVEKC